MTDNTKEEVVSADNSRAPKKQGLRGLKGLFAKPVHPINDDDEIMKTVWERNRPNREGRSIKTSLDL